MYGARLAMELIMIPDIAATIPPIASTCAKTRPTGTPFNWAASRFWAVARIARPEHEDAAHLPRVARPRLLALRVAAVGEARRQRRRPKLFRHFRVRRAGVLLACALCLNEEPLF